LFIYTMRLTVILSQVSSCKPLNLVVV